MYASPFAFNGLNIVVILGMCIIDREQHIYEPVHKVLVLITSACSKGAYQSAHMQTHNNLHCSHTQGIDVDEGSVSSFPGPEVIKLFSCLNQLSMKF